MFDISTPLSPIRVGEFGAAGELNGPTGLAITGTTLYVSNQLDNTIAIYDIFHPPSPFTPPQPLIVGKFGIGEVNGPAGLAITGNVLFVANQSNSTVERYNISYPPGPVRVGEFGEGEVSGPTGLAITGTTLYVANRSAGTVAIYSLPPGPVFPPAPTRVGEFGTGE